MTAIQPVRLQLVPHYAEGVIYPLDNDEVAERIGAKVEKGDLGDELVEQMSGLDVSTIDFLRIQFKDEWDNFVQRMIGRYKLQGIVDPERVTERDFRLSEGGVFSSAQLPHSILSSSGSFAAIVTEHMQPTSLTLLLPVLLCQVQVVDSEVL